MIVFRLKSYSALSSGAKWLKNNPGVPLSATSLGFVVYNTRANTKVRQQEADYKQRHLEVINNLTNQLSQTSNDIKRVGESLNKNNAALANNTGALLKTPVRQTNINQTVKPAPTATKRRASILSRIFN